MIFKPQRSSLSSYVPRLPDCLSPSPALHLKQRKLSEVIQVRRTIGWGKGILSLLSLKLMNALLDFLLIHLFSVLFKYLSVGQNYFYILERSSPKLYCIVTWKTNEFNRVFWDIADILFSSLNHRIFQTFIIWCGVSLRIWFT